MWKKYDRAGFVEAVRVADTLFILRDEFKNLKNEEITIEALNKAEEAAWAAAKKAGVSKDNFVSYKYVLSGDNHKYVTWSMRFVDRNAAANEVELIDHSCSNQCRQMVLTSLLQKLLG